MSNTITKTLDAFNNDDIYELNDYVDGRWPDLLDEVCDAVWNGVGSVTSVRVVDFEIEMRGGPIDQTAHCTLDFIDEATGATVGIELQTGITFGTLVENVEIQMNPDYFREINVGLGDLSRTYHMYTGRPTERETAPTERHHEAKPRRKVTWVEGNN